MNVFDFDGTLYDGESGTDFYKFCYFCYPSVAKYIPRIVYGFLGHHIMGWDRRRMKEQYFKYFGGVDALELVEEFWDENIHKIASWYKDIQKDDDLVITASPRFLIEPACRRLGIKNLIASEVDHRTGKYHSENCRDEEKVRRFRAEFGDANIDSFYSDSDSDLPLARLAGKAYKVVDMRVVDWNITE